MNKRNYDLSDEIKFIIQDALNMKNFSKLNDDISRTIKSAMNDVNNGFSGAPKQPVNASWHPKEDGDNSWHSVKTQSTLAISKSPPGRVSGVLLSIFGYCGVGIFGVSLLGYGITTTFLNLGIFINSITFGTLIPLFLVFVGMAAKGTQLNNRIKRFRRYLVKLNGRSVCNVDELASSIQKSQKFVVKDLKNMIRKGIFPQGHIDRQEVAFMLDDITFKQYEESIQRTITQKEEEAHRQEQQAQTQKAQQNEGEEQKKLRITIEEGKAYVAQIQKANDAILGIEVSNKLFRLEAITTKIFDHIESHPEQISEIRKFMSYYLPTTLKLTNAYRELDNQPTMGENISSAKAEIEKTLDTINGAFENLLDDLFYHAAMDISSDISVLETMLAQEGLVEKDFDINKKMED